MSNLNSQKVSGSVPIRPRKVYILRRERNEHEENDCGSTRRAKKNWAPSPWHVRPWHAWHAIMAHRYVDWAGNMDKKLIPSAVLNTTSQNFQAHPASGLKPKIIMGAVVAIALVFGLYQSMKPSDYSSCILKELPGTENDMVALAKANKCNQKFGDQSAIVPTSTPESQDCLIKYAASTANKRTVYIIRRACLLKFGTNSDPLNLFSANPPSGEFDDLIPAPPSLSQDIKGQSSK